MICRDLAELPVLLLAGYNSFLNFAEHSQWHSASGPNEIKQTKNILFGFREKCFNLSGKLLPICL